MRTITTKNQYLRHTLATIKYRFDKSIKGTKAGFAIFSLGKGSRSPLEIVVHMHHVLHFTTLLLEACPSDKTEHRDSTLEDVVKRFYQEIDDINRVLCTTDVTVETTKKILQGPFADILTHIGQVAMMQRLHDNPIDGEDFSVAEICG